MTPYRFQRGETIVLALDAVGATAQDLEIVSGVSAVLKKTVNGDGVPPATAPAAATCTVSTRPPAGGADGGWLLTIDAASSAQLAPGTYVTNAALELGAGGSIEKTDALFIRIEEST